MRRRRAKEATSITAASARFRATAPTTCNKDFTSAPYRRVHHGLRRAVVRHATGYRSEQGGRTLLSTCSHCVDAVTLVVSSSSSTRVPRLKDDARLTLVGVTPAEPARRSSRLVCSCAGLVATIGGRQYRGVERKRWQQCLRVLGLLGQLEVELRAVPVFIGQVQVSG